MQRVYLDNAATSWPKPPAVYDVVDRYQRQEGLAAGRGAYAAAVQLAQRLEHVRHQLAQLLHAEHASRLVFTYSGTDALTLAIRGLVRPGDHVVTTVAEHNSVLRPLRFLRDTQRVEVSYVGFDAQGQLDLNQLRHELRDTTRLVTIVHASNVDGRILPVSDVASIVARHPAARLLIDAAQTIGHLPIDVQSLECDLLAASGHKGLLAPLGTGLLYIRPGVEEELLPWRLGGTGSASESDLQPDSLPDRYEAGNLNVPGILGLGEGLSFLQNRGLDNVRSHIGEMSSRLIDGLGRIPQAAVFAPADEKARTGVVSFNLDGYDPQEVAVLLDQIGHVQSRAGFHCAPRIHRALETLEFGGTVRLSSGPFTTSSDIETALATLTEIAG